MVGVAFTIIAVLAPELRGAGEGVTPMNPATGLAWDIKRAAVPTVTSRVTPRSVAGLLAARDYWVREYKRRWREERADGKARARTIRRLRAQLDRDPTVGAAICAVFGSRCAEARRVAWCESRYYTGAANGQYLGLFQVSEHWRRKIAGFGPSAIAQSLHAYRVFRLTGSNWSHWECRP